MRAVHHSKDEYDAIIIGAGIGALVCGCYLAKAGMKVLICEQHSKPGGYCTSFKRKGFTFDAAAHSFGGYGQTGIIRKVLQDLELHTRLRIRRFDPSDIVITPERRVTFWSDIDKTIDSFRSAFPQERNNIKDFFSLLTNSEPRSFAFMRKWTFFDLLNRYFTDVALKSVLSFPLFGNGGLPPSLMSVFTGINIFTEFLLNGGCYPEGGMQALPDALAERFREFGGELRLFCPVKKIRTRNAGVTGAVIDKDGFVSSKYVVSGCDARQTFLNLLGGQKAPDAFLKKLRSMTPSLSGFLVYLGIDKPFDALPDKRVTLWFLSDYDLDKAYLSATKGDFAEGCGFMIHVSPDQRTALIFANAPYKTKRYWDTYKTVLTDVLISKIERHVIPGLSAHTLYKGTATPLTLQRYTGNYRGAAYGWACTPSQFAITDFRKPSFVRGLYLTSHWATYGHGIPGVAYAGYSAARTILRGERLGDLRFSCN